MDFIVAALLLLCFQQFAWPAPELPTLPVASDTAVAPVTPADGQPRAVSNVSSRVVAAAPTTPDDGSRRDAEPPPIETLLAGRSSTADHVALAGLVVDASPTFG